MNAANVPQLLAASREQKCHSIHKGFLACTKSFVFFFQISNKMVPAFGELIIHEVRHSQIRFRCTNTECLSACCVLETFMPPKSLRARSMS